MCDMPKESKARNTSSIDNSLPIPNPLIFTFSLTPAPTTSISDTRRRRYL